MTIEVNNESGFEVDEAEFAALARYVLDAMHLHPQTELVEGDKWAGEHLHAFGNLCLVSHAMNSRLSNSGPEDKFKQLMSEKKSQSLKVFAMHSEFVKQRQWAAEVAMHQHEEKMLALMQQAFEADGLINLGIAQTTQKEGVL